MRFRLRDLPAMLRTPAGRMHVRQGIAYRSWPLLSPLAQMYRRTLVRDTRVIAVTGSFGKSTTARAIAAAYSLAAASLNREAGILTKRMVAAMNAAVIAALIQTFRQRVSAATRMPWFVSPSEAP